MNTSHAPLMLWPVPGNRANSYRRGHWGNVGRAAMMALLGLSGVAVALAATDRAQFIRECLHAVPTAHTQRFDDYTPGSYHVEKLDLIAGLEAAVREEQRTLRAVIVFGPTGPLWAYHIVVALAEGDSVRVNSLVFPHARITGKGTGTLPAGEFRSLFASVIGSKLLRAGTPAPGKEKEALADEFSYNLIIADWTNGQRTLRHAALEPYFYKAGPERAQAQALVEQINALLKATKSTYPPTQKGQTK